MNDWLHYISIPLVILTVALFLKNRKVNTKPNTIKQPKMYFSAGVFISSIGSLLALLVGLFSTPNNETETVIGIMVLLGFSIIGIVLICWCLNWKIEVNEDDLVFRNGFRKQTKYQINDLAYDSYNAKSDVYKGNKLVFSVTVLMQNYSLISKTIKVLSYNSNSTGTIKGNSNARNFGLSFSIFGVVFVLLFILTLYFSENVAEIIISYVLLAVGMIVLFFGIFLILFRYVWKMAINESKVEVTNVFSVKRSYHKKDLKYQVTNHGYKVFLNDTKIIYFNENFTEQPKLIYSLMLKK